MYLVRLMCVVTEHIILLFLGCCYLKRYGYFICGIRYFTVEISDDQIYRTREFIAYSKTGFGFFLPCSVKSGFFFVLSTMRYDDEDIDILIVTVSTTRTMPVLQWLCLHSFKLYNDNIYMIIY